MSSHPSTKHTIYGVSSELFQWVVFNGNASHEVLPVSIGISWVLYRIFCKGRGEGDEIDANFSENYVAWQDTLTR